MRSLSKTPLLACALVVLLAAPGARAQDLTLDEALRLTLERNPRLSALREAHLAATGRRIDAGAWPNPELSFEAENVRFADGPGSRTAVTDAGGALIESAFDEVSDSGFGGSELTLSVSQRIELGGKRSRRIAIADHETQAALWDFEVARAAALAQTRQAFVAVLAAQETVALRARLAQLASDAADAVSVRVDAGKDSPMLSDRAQVEAAQARIALASAERRAQAARYALAAQWDERNPTFDAVVGTLDAVHTPPNREMLLEALDDSPQLSRWAEEVALRDAGVTLARAERLPDLTLSLGWRGIGLAESDSRVVDASGNLTNLSRTLPEDDWDHSLVFGVSIPLPLFSRNRGGIAEAEHRALSASHERRAARAEAWARIAESLAEVQAAHDTATELRESVLPAAERAHDAAEFGFESGKFTYLESLDTLRTLFEVQSQYIDALADFHRGLAELERIVGSPLDAAPRAGEGTQP